MLSPIVKYTALAAVLIAAGCGRDVAQPPAELSDADLKPVLTAATQGATQNIRDQTETYLTDMQNHKLIKAYAEIRQLTASPDVSMDKRATFARAARTTLKDLQAAADAGDTQAAETLRVQRLTK